MRKAIDHYEKALIIAREIGHRRDEGIWLSNLGNRYSELGKTNAALKNYEQALAISHETSNKMIKSSVLDNLGHEYLSIEDFQSTKEKIQQSIQIADEIYFSMPQHSSRLGLAQVYLLQNDLNNARAVIKAALEYNVPLHNHNASALYGIIVLRQGDTRTARQAFTRAIAQADEILAKTPEYYEALDAKGLALCGLILCRDAVPASGQGNPAPTVDDAIETFRAARKIAPHAGIVKRNLRLFDELAKCDTEGLMEGVREAVEGKVKNND